MSFDCEDVPLDYQLFIGTVSYLLKHVQPDPIGPVPEFELSFVQRGHPSYKDIWRHAEWLLRMTQRCCFSLTSFLCSAIYIDRLIRQGRLSLYESTWRSTWVAMTVLSEKRWEDNYVHPGHIHATYGSRHTSQEQAVMQLKLFKALNFSMYIDEGEFWRWQCRLRDERDHQIMAALQFQRVFIPRPIPNLKTKSQNTPSTAATSESESERRYPRHSVHGHGQPHHYHQLTNAGYAVTPRAQADSHLQPSAHIKQGAATSRRGYGGSQLNWDQSLAMSHHASTQRPGVGARDLPTTRTSDFWQLDLRLNELRKHDYTHQRNPEHPRNSCGYSESQHGSYQYRHNVPAQRQMVGRSAYLDRAGLMPPSLTSRATQLDLNFPRSSVVWS
eukprot:gnl/MRDRNA2_/MRDRNA2_204875_c0_seq1.p1 gnl/MRDRNA2_/MRDRNA2_204875_c0~~gnl/MRDRNA2_/MRDRNA2_204875_c0_seq1.p1  ORF type:complete len:386 (+),score=37.68 gnl/MRDRNA2_/MRDRNA2_204875_c0_seq1:111-1268(+)